MDKTISKDRMMEIEKITSKILNDANYAETPYVDIVPLVRKEGFDVMPSEMPLSTTGCLFVNDEGAVGKKIRLIMVNTKFKNPDKENDVVLKKSRFITAHEYGHFILHKKEREPIYAHRDTDHRTELFELEADYFARSILMPRKTFELYYGVLKEVGNGDNAFAVDILSRVFKVTRNKVQKRVEDILELG